MNKLKRILHVFLQIFGVLALSQLLHEFIHILQSKSIQSLCLEFGGKSAMYVTATNFHPHTEVWAYGIQSLFMIACFYFIIKGERQ